MKYRKLRIAWSVVCGVLCLLLIVLWVRSFSYHDIAALRITPQRSCTIDSVRGALIAVEIPVPMAWELFSRTIGPNELASIKSRWRVGYEPRIPGYYLTIPHWFAALLLAMIGVLPWIGSIWRSCCYDAEGKLRAD
jgi:hypothetical protein